MLFDVGQLINLSLDFRNVTDCVDRLHVVVSN